MDLRKERQHTPFHYVTQGLKILLVVAVIFSCLFTINQFRISRSFPIKTVRIYSADHADHKEIQALLASLVDRGFFNINVDYIRDRLLQLPWVADILVRRIWPDQVEIRVIERRPIARWDEQTLLSDAGDLFQPQPETIPRDIPRFVGPNGRQLMMLNYFNEINRILLPLHAKISYLELTPYLTWKLTLDNGIALQIGQTDILTRLYHFVRVYPKIIGDRVSDVEYIDLRYPNGIAIRWKEAVKT